MKPSIQAFMAFLMLGSQLFADKPSSTSKMTEERAIEILTKVSSFGFGAKDGQQERESDTAFQTILSNPKAKDKFTALIEKGGTAAKLYSLCALHHIDLAAYQKLIKSIKMDEVVRTQFGCVVGESKTKEILERIDNGDFDREFNVAK